MRLCIHAKGLVLYTHASITFKQYCSCKTTTQTMNVSFSWNVIKRWQKKVLGYIKSYQETVCSVLSSPVFARHYVSTNISIYSKDVPSKQYFSPVFEYFFTKGSSAVFFRDSSVTFHEVGQRFVGLQWSVCSTSGGYCSCSVAYVFQTQLMSVVVFVMTRIRIERRIWRENHDFNSKGWW